MNPYRQCPIYQNENYRIRFVKQSDVKDLLKVYSDPKTVALCNCDNCEDDFYYTSRVRMEQAINYWIMEYHREGFVRWSILDCTSSTAIGTMELFKRSANDAYDNTAVLRLDLLSKYEEQSCLQEILSLILPHIRDLFQCTQVITKCVQEAEKRRAVLLEMGFSPSKESLVGWDGTLYQNYYLRKL